MIKRITDREIILPLWEEAFGDTEEDICFFLDNAPYRCIACFEGAVPAAMLFLVPCTLAGKEAAYIYAACTQKAYRGKGCMTQLLEYCKRNEARLCLIPASDVLCAYYTKRGFSRKAAIESISFTAHDAIREMLFEGYQLTEPTALYYER